MPRTNIPDVLRAIQDTMTDFLLQPFDAEGRQRLRQERERLRELQPRYDAILLYIESHPEQPRLLQALMVFTGTGALPSGGRQNPYWQRVAQMNRKIRQFSPDSQLVQWLETAIPFLEELLGKEESAQ